MQQSRDKYFPQFENQDINPVGDNAQITEYLHKEPNNTSLAVPTHKITNTCTQRKQGVVNPLVVNCKVRSDRDG